jgi:hypothetical protein
VSEDANWFGGLPAVTIGEGYHGDSVRRLPDIVNNQKIDWKAKVSLNQGLQQMWDSIKTTD